MDLVRSVRVLRRQRGLSLNEMLIVIVVFAILASIFLYSSRGMVVRVKVSRVKQEQDTLAHSLNVHRVRNEAFPTAEEGLIKLLQNSQYMAQIPRDPFSKDGNEIYRYVSFGDENYPIRPQWLLISVGPDGDIDYPSKNEEEITSQTGGGSFSARGGSASRAGAFPQSFHELILTLTYDPTNGIDSSGDIFRWGY